jgi:exodeoxyribonuclease V alpha subunit
MALNTDNVLFSPSAAGTFLKVTGKIGEQELRQAAFFAQMLPVKSAREDLHTLLLFLLACLRKGVITAGPAEFSDVLTQVPPMDLYASLRNEGVEESTAHLMSEYKPQLVRQSVGEWFANMMDNESCGNLFPMVQHESMAVDERQPLIVYRPEQNSVSFKAYYKSETVLSEKLPPLLEYGDEPIDGEKALRVAAKALGTAFNGHSPHVRQVAGLLLSLNTKLVIIAGGPGSGKTSTLHAIVRAVAEYHAIPASKIALCAPNGRAKERLREMIAAGNGNDGFSGDCKAVTLHSLLDAGTEKFNFPSGEILPYGLIMVDEINKADMQHFAALIDRLPPDCRLVVAGDMSPLFTENAGPVMGNLTLDLSKEPGMGSLSDSVVDEMKEIIRKLPSVANISELGQMRTGSPSILVDRVVFLTHNYRCDRHIIKWWERHCGLKQDDDTPECIAAPVSIIEYIRKSHMNTGNGPQDNYNGWLSIWMENWWVQVYDQWRRYFRPRLLEGDIESRADTEGFCHLMERMNIVCCVEEGMYGREATNFYCDTVFWRTKKNSGEKPHWHDGQTVIVKADHPGEEELYCGDMGMVLEKNDGLFVCFSRGCRIVSIPLQELNTVETAYALSVSQVQRSEFREIMFVMPEVSELPLTRQMVYAGITRTKKRVTIIDPGDRLVDIRKLPGKKRNDFLKKILHE